MNWSNIDKNGLIYSNTNHFNEREIMYLSKLNSVISNPLVLVNYFDKL